MNLESITSLFKPLFKPKVAGGLLLGTIGFASFLTLTGTEVDKRYINAGGSTNTPISRYEKMKYLHEHNQTTTNRVEYLNTTN